MVLVVQRLGDTPRVEDPPRGSGRRSLWGEGLPVLMPHPPFPPREGGPGPEPPAQPAHPGAGAGGRARAGRAE